jgi:hypothetical protein
LTIADRRALPDDLARLSHLYVQNRSVAEDFHRRGGGDPHINPVENRAGHGGSRKAELTGSFDDVELRRTQVDDLTEDELSALGSIITLEGVDPAYPLKINSLERGTTHRLPRPQWLLLSVIEGDGQRGVPERAVVWVSDAYRARFLKLFEDYLTENSAGGQPKNRELVANIARIRTAVLRDLWQSSGEPDTVASRWWEVWLRPDQNSIELMRRYAQAQGFRVSPRVLTLSDRVITWVEASWSQLEVLPFTAVPVAEIRRPEFVETIEDLPGAAQGEYVADLLSRLTPAARSASPAVVHLDTGVARTHVLLEGSLHEDDLHTVIGISGFDRDGHGTSMAGVALYGDLDALLSSSNPVTLRHGLESVRMMPAGGERPNDPIAYGDITAQAVSTPEAVSRRPRVFCLPITARAESADRPGQPTLWSATIDALSVGVGVVRDREELTLLGAPDPEASRLINRGLRRQR